MTTRRPAALSALLLLALLSIPSGCEKESAPLVTPELPAAAAPSSADSAPERAVHRPLFYRIEGKGGPVYLLGTIHVGFDAKKELPAYVWDALKRSDLFVMETDLGAAQVMMAARAAIGEGGDLKTMLGDESWAELDQRLGGVADQFRRVKPWFVVSVLTLKMLPEGALRDPMDQALHAWATDAGKELAYLESPDYQIGVLEQTLTASELKEMLAEYDQQKNDLDAMLSYYREGDVERMAAISFKDMEIKPEMYEKLFFKRNELWVSKIESYLKRGNVFVAFGAGHLLGERGVLALLEEKGYEVTRLETAAAVPDEAADAE